MKNEKKKVEERWGVGGGDGGRAGGVQWGCGGSTKNSDGFFSENSVNFFDKPTFHLKIKKKFLKSVL